MTPISIVIITLNEAECIGNLLSDLSHQTYQKFEVILVDSNSEDNTCKIAQSFNYSLDRLTIHKMNTRGVCLGRNTGASLAKYEQLLFLDADVRLPIDFIENSIKILNSKNIEVAGVYLSANGLPKHFFYGYKVFNAGIFITQFTFPTAIGACLFSTRSIHQKINGFDGTISLCEDCDYVRRASKVTKFKMLPIAFSFNPRRLKQDGYLKTGWKYLHANLHRFFIGEIRNNKINYQFGHYKSNNPSSTKSSNLPHNPQKSSIVNLSTNQKP